MLAVRHCPPAIAKGILATPQLKWCLKEARQRHYALWGENGFGATQKEMEQEVKLAQIVEQSLCDEHQIERLLVRLHGKPRGELFPHTGKKGLVSRFLGAMQTAIGDKIGWDLGSQVLADPNPEHALEVVLSSNKIRYPATVRSGQLKVERKMSDQNHEVSGDGEVKATRKGGRVGKLAGKRIFYDAENNRRPGTKSHATIEIVRANPGLTVDELKELGADPAHILWDIKDRAAENAVRLEDASEV